MFRLEIIVNQPLIHRQMTRPNGGANVGNGVRVVLYIRSFQEVDFFAQKTE